MVAAAVGTDFDAAAYWEERHAKTEGLAGVGYLGLNKFNDWAYRVRKHVFRRVLRRHEVRGARVLDVGSGTGFYLDLWGEQPLGELVGSDFSAVACERLRVAYPRVSIQQLDITTEDPAALEAMGQFDFISIIDVLYHIVDDTLYDRALVNLGRLLKPGGKLIFTENFLQATKRSGNAWQVSREMTEIEAGLREADLSVVSREPWFVLMNGPVDSQSVVHQGAWWLMRKASERSATVSYLLGAAMYPAELVLTKVLDESPTSEIAVARRNG